VFVLTLQDEELREILKELLGVDTNYEIVKIFLAYDATIMKSKYVTKYTGNMIKYMNG